MPTAISCPTVDVLILGAGPAGAGLAVALKQAGVDKILLIDRPARRPFRMGESAGPNLGSLLRRIGLDDRLEAQGHRPCHGNLSIWGRALPTAEDFMFNACGPGWLLDRNHFDRWLRAGAVERGAVLCTPAQLLAARRDGDAWQVALRAVGRNHEVSARWIVDASGRPAWFARRSGAQLTRVDRLMAIAAPATPRKQRGFGGFVVVEAGEHGWWYAAHLPDGNALVTLMTDPDLAGRADLLSPSGFRRAWAATAAIADFVAPTDPIPQPVRFAAGTQFVDRAIAPGWLSIGDALIALDPLSASGVTGALEDAIEAADTIVALLAEPDKERSRERRSAYAARANAMLCRYLAERAAIYGRERRWSASPFWQRRHVSHAAIDRASALV